MNTDKSTIIDANGNSRHHLYSYLNSSFFSCFLFVFPLTYLLLTAYICFILAST